jgi:hypothetical protein
LVWQQPKGIFHFKEKEMNPATDWLTGGPAWLRYRTLIDLKGDPVDSGEVVSARFSLLKDPQVATIISELEDWPGRAIKRHNDAGHPLHKLVFLADLGLHKFDRAIDPIVQRILQHQSETGAFQVIVNISAAYGGSGQDVGGWALCDSPSVLYSLAKMGLRSDGRVQKAARNLADLATDIGWPCAVSPEMGTFKGPGRKNNPCPYATLVALKALAQFPEWKEHQVCRAGAESLLELWRQRKVRKAYLFGMGTDFAKLKAPQVWYDILHVAEVLTQFPWLHHDKRLQEMLSLIESKADSEGHFAANSVWRAWSGWDFGQKIAPSFWITFLIHRMLMRNAE